MAVGFRIIVVAIVILDYNGGDEFWCEEIAIKFLFHYTLPSLNKRKATLKNAVSDKQ